MPFDDSRFLLRVQDVDRKQTMNTYVHALKLWVMLRFGRWPDGIDARRVYEQTVAVKVTEHAVANGVLEFAPVGGREMGGLVELD